MKALLLALSLSASVACAQSLPVKLRDGDSWSFTSKHERLVDGQKSQDYTVTTIKTLTWRSAVQDTGQLLMQHISIAASGDMPPEAATTQTLTIPIKLTVDNALAPNGVINVDEVRTATRNLILSSGASEADLGKMLKLNPAILDQTSMALIGRELGLLGRMQGTNLKKDLPFYSEDEVPNPLGGPLLRSRITYDLLDYDADSGRAVINWKAEVDPQSLGDSMAEMIGNVPEAERARAQAAMDKTKLELTRTCRGDVDIVTGLATKLTCRNLTTITSDGQKSRIFDLWEITQTLPGKPQ